MGSYPFSLRTESALKKESKFQADLIKDLKDLFPGCLVLKNDSSYIQGVPDLLVLYGSRWAMLECKRSDNEPRQPNQDYYVDILDKMSYASFIHPENVEDVLHDLSRAMGRGSKLPPLRSFK